MAHGLFVACPSPGCGPRWPGWHDPCHPFRPSTGEGYSWLQWCASWLGRTPVLLPRQAARAPAPPSAPAAAARGPGPWPEAGPRGLQAGAPLRRAAAGEAGICGVTPSLSRGTCSGPRLGARAPLRLRLLLPLLESHRDGDTPRLPQASGAGLGAPGLFGPPPPSEPLPGGAFSSHTGAPIPWGGCSCAPGSEEGAECQRAPGPLPGERPRRGLFHGDGVHPQGVPDTLAAWSSCSHALPKQPWPALQPPLPWQETRQVVQAVSKNWCCYGPRRRPPAFPTHTGGTEGEGQAPEAAAATEGRSTGGGSWWQ